MTMRVVTGEVKARGQGSESSLRAEAASGSLASASASLPPSLPTSSLSRLPFSTHGHGRGRGRLGSTRRRAGGRFRLHDTWGRRRWGRIAVGGAGWGSG
jgi:hypothetical protein